MSYAQRYANNSTQGDQPKAVPINGVEIREAAKMLNIKGGQNGLHKVLRQLSIFSPQRLPHYAFVEKGFFRLETKQFHRGGVYHTYHKAFVTPKGLTWLDTKIPAEYRKPAEQ